MNQAHSIKLILLFVASFAFFGCSDNLSTTLNEVEAKFLDPEEVEKHRNELRDYAIFLRKERRNAQISRRDYNEALYNAVVLCLPKEVERHLSRGANVSSRTLSAAFKNYFKEQGKSNGDTLKIIKLLIEAGTETYRCEIGSDLVDINSYSRRYFSVSPLDVALYRWDISLSEYLYSKGFQENASDINLRKIKDELWISENVSEEIWHLVNPQEISSEEPMPESNKSRLSLEKKPKTKLGIKWSDAIKFCEALELRDVALGRFDPKYKYAPVPLPDSKDEETEKGFYIAKIARGSVWTFGSGEKEKTIQ